MTLGESKHITHAVTKSLNPDWNETAQLPVNGVQHLLLDVCCWDKDRFGKDYLGEFDLALEEIFASGKTEQEPKWFPLKSKRPGKKTSVVSGEVLLQFTLLDASNKDATDNQILDRFMAVAKQVPEAESSSKAPTPTLTPVLAPTRPAGPSPPLSRRQTENDDDDEYDVYDEEVGEEEELSKVESSEKRKRRLRIKGLKRKKRDNPYEFVNGGSDVVGLIFLEIQKITDLPPESNFTKTSFDMDPFVVASLGKKTFRTKTVRHNLNPTFNEKMLFQVQGHEQKYSFVFNVIDLDRYSGNDFIASTALPIQELMDRAPKASPETGLYDLPDPPEYVPSQRSRFIRLGMSRSTSAQSLGKLNRPVLSKNPSTISQAVQPGPTSAPLPQEVADAPPLPLPSPGLLAPTENPLGAGNGNGGPSLAAAAGDLSTESDDPGFTSFTLPLKMKNLDKWESKHNPQIYIKAKYMPYPALRQQFWRAMLKQYDTDESGCLSRVELTTMLDTLGSTLRESTIDSFFKRFSHKDNAGDETWDLTMDEAVICLEDQLEAKSRTPTLADRMRDLLPDADKVKSYLAVPGKPGPALPLPNESSAAVSQDAGVSGSTINVPELATPGEEGEALDRDDLNDKGEEHVVEIRECPICHQPRLNKRKDADIITHIATCASQDWRQVNNLVMGGFVTASQAQRKWYSKVITKISYGGYKLGANSANILVQDRITGQISEEKMSVYVRLGIRLLYKGLKSNNMENKRSKFRVPGRKPARGGPQLTRRQSASS